MKGATERQFSQGRRLSTPSVVGVCKVNSCGAHLVELLIGPRDGVGQVDDVEDFRAAEAGDLHGTHAVRLEAQGATSWPARP